MWTLANPIKHAANEKGLVTNINSNNLVPSFLGVDTRMHILCGASALLPTGDRLVNFVRSQRVSVVTLSSTSANNVSAAWAARGGTPLHWAARNGHVEVVKLLVEVASLAVQNEDGRGPQLQSTWISGLGASLLASLGGSPNSRCR